MGFLGEEVRRCRSFLFLFVGASALAVWAARRDGYDEHTIVKSKSRDTRRIPLLNIRFLLFFH